MKRRDFLRSTALGAAALAVSPSLFNACTSVDPLHEFGIITGNTVKEMIGNDPRGTLEILAKMGYKYLEFGGTYGMEVKELKAFLNDIGMVPLAGGASISGLQGDKLKEVIDAQLLMGKKYLVCYWPWMHGGENPTMDDVKFAVDEFNRIGEICNTNDLRFAFHNHDKEFTKIGDQVIYDYILEYTEPELLTMQLDLYWIFVGGADPIEYFKKYPGRFELLHVKDALDPNDRESFTCVGAGVIDFEAIFRMRNEGGFKHLIVERDRGDIPEEECARMSINHLKSLKF